MKRSRLLGAMCASLYSLVSISPHAALVNNGGGLIYDTVYFTVYFMKSNLSLSGRL